MGNRTSRHLHPGQHDLRGKRTAIICRCCDRMVNHKDKILADIHADEMRRWNPEDDERKEARSDE